MQGGSTRLEGMAWDDLDRQSECVACGCGKVECEIIWGEGEREFVSKREM